MGGAGKRPNCRFYRQPTIMIAQTWLPQVAPFLMFSAFLAEPGAVATVQTLYLNLGTPLLLLWLSIGRTD
jgi:hypothetical protein